MIETRPSHIPQERVFAFNIFNDARFRGDVHEALVALQKAAPDVFWTPENGGHWVVTRMALMDEVLRGHERFSSAGNQSPNVPESMPMIPLNLDPPDHTYYRTILSRHFGASAIRRLEPRVQYWAKELIDRVAGKDECDFMEEIASLFPVSIFMELMGLPLERLREYRAIVVEYFGDISPERYMVLQNEITRQMREILDARRDDPRDDLATRLQTDDLDGRRMTAAELDSLTNLLFQAGMDTVANFAGFFFRFLAHHPEIQDRMRDHPEDISAVMEEGFRLFGVVNVGRKVRRDLELGGVQMREGEIVMCMLPLAGRDPAANPDPDRFDADRRGRDYMLFSRGVHMCVGHVLARAEMKALLAEWFGRMPNFRIADGTEPHLRAGMVMGIDGLRLAWGPRPTMN